MTRSHKRGLKSVYIYIYNYIDKLYRYISILLHLFACCAYWPQRLKTPFWGEGHIIYALQLPLCPGHKVIQKQRVSYSLQLALFLGHEVIQK